MLALTGIALAERPLPSNATMIGWELEGPAWSAEAANRDAAMVATFPVLAIEVLG
jgi:hypothetical protein